MRRTPQTIGLGSSGVRRMAGVVLGVAVLVALFGNDSGAAADTDAPITAGKGATAPAAPRVARKAPQLAVGSTTGFPDDGAGLDLSAPDPAALADTSGDAASAGSTPVVSPLKPDPAGMERLIAASRARSGGVDQGDEPVG